MKNKNRILYLDVIRILAVLLVIFTHTGEIGNKLYTVEHIGRISKLFALMLDVIRCINVPLFFMVSGALMLKKEISYKDLFFKYIFKYILVTIFISYFYYIFLWKAHWYDFISFFKTIYGSYMVYHLWFLYSYIGYLLMFPLIKKMINGLQKQDYIYFLMLGLVFKGGSYIIGTLMGEGEIGIKCSMVTDNIFYPIMGYFFGVVLADDECRHLKVAIPVTASAVCVFVSMCMVYWEGAVQGEEYTENFISLLTVIPTVSTFYIIRKIFLKHSCPETVKMIVGWCGELTFGVYLFSIYIQRGRLMLLREKLADLMPSFPMLSTIVYVIAVWLVGLMLVGVGKLCINFIRQ